MPNEIAPSADLALPQAAVVGHLPIRIHANGGVFFVQRPVRVIWRGAAGEPDSARLARLWAQTWLSLSDKLEYAGIRGSTFKGDA